MFRSQIEARDIDMEEEDKVTHFCSNGCSCSMKCSFQFSAEHIRLLRANVAQLDRSQVDMMVMGQVMAFTNCSKTPLHSSKHRHRYKEREKTSTVFYHQGLRVCRKTFLFLHNIGNSRFKAIKAHYLSQGLVPRIHKHTGRIAPNALVMDDVKGIISFVMQYAETNGILLPGRIPGYKRDDIQLLPSSTTKRAVWLLYEESASNSGVRPVAYTTFCHVWRNFLGHVVVCKPMTDLCATCQRNSTAIIRSINMSESDKSQVCVNCTYTTLYLVYAKFNT